MILAKDDIEKAVSWWAGKLMDHQPHSNGDDSFTSVAVCFLADTMRQSVTLNQLNTFKAALAKSIEEYAKSIQAFGFSIGSDYGPCKMLADAAAEAGIDRANFPFKTTMFFTEKEGIWVRDGYCAPPASIDTTMKEAYRAETVWLTIRYALAWHDFPEGGQWVDFYEPMNRSDQPMPKVELKLKGEEK